MWLDWLAAGLAIVSATLIRRRKWQGYAISLPAQGLYAYICIDRALYGFLLLVAFYLVNSALGLIQWRDLDAQVTPEYTLHNERARHGR